MEILIDGKNVFECNLQTISEAWEVLRKANKLINQKLVKSFYLGQKVSFISRKKVEVFGWIVKINSKSIKVIPTTNANMTWRVSPSLLTPADF